MGKLLLMEVYRMVYVISKEGKRLMPTNRHGKVRRLLREGRAKVISKSPFTIQLLYETTEYAQETVVSINTGKTMGFAVVNKNSGRVLQKGEIRFRDDISKLIRQRAEYRRSRRNRKTRYRQPRFLNRRRPEGWLAPSIRTRLEHIIKWIERLTTYLPKTQVVVKIAKFDMQKLEKPNISGEGYQQGDLYGYETVKQYLIARENGRCQLCGKGYDVNGWHIHHIIPRSKGGTDRPSNLALLHKECHTKLHQNFEKYAKKIKKPVIYKEASYLNSYRLQLMNTLRKLFDGRVKFTSGMTSPSPITTLKPHLTGCLLLPNTTSSGDEYASMIIPPLHPAISVPAEQLHQHLPHNHRHLSPWQNAR